MPIGAFLGGVYTWLVGVAGARAALVIFAAGTIITCTAALLIIVKNLIVWIAAAAALAVVGLPAAFAMAFWSIVPGNLGALVGAVLSCDAAIFACKYHLNLIKVMSQ